MKKISIWGVLIGGVLDVIATNILAIPFILFMVITRIDFLGLSPVELTRALTQMIQGHWLLFAIQLMIGSFCSILGGYVVAWIARHDELINGALSAYLCVGIGIYSLMSGQAVESLTLAVLGFILSPALALFGGYLRQLQIQFMQQRTKQIVTA